MIKVSKSFSTHKVFIISLLALLLAGCSVPFAGNKKSGSLKEMDQSICLQISDAASKDNCYLRVAYSKQDVSICDKVIGKTKENCYTQIAIAKEDVFLCQMINSISCYENVAALTNDATICDIIKTDSCYSQFLNSYSNIDEAYCLKFTSSDYADKCYAVLAYTTRNSSLCNKIKTETWRNSCLSQIGVSAPKTKSDAVIRDEKRIIHIKQIQTGIELFYADQNYYPIEQGIISLGSGSSCGVACSSLSSKNGFDSISSGIVYIGQVPVNPESILTDICSKGSYTYETKNNGQSYEIKFCLEVGTSALSRGVHIASPTGIK